MSIESLPTDEIEEVNSFLSCYNFLRNSTSEEQTLFFRAALNELLLWDAIELDHFLVKELGEWYNKKIIQDTFAAINDEELGEINEAVFRYFEQK